MKVKQWTPLEYFGLIEELTEEDKEITQEIKRIIKTNLENNKPFQYEMTTENYSKIIVDYVNSYKRTLKVNKLKDKINGRDLERS